MMFTRNGKVVEATRETSIISFRVLGIPKPWKRAGVMSRVRRKDGSFRHLDRPIHFDRTDKPWHSLIYQEALKVAPPQPLEGPLRLILEFELLKPKSKPKYRTMSDTKPDIDNLAKGIQDVLRGVIYRDDAQIAVKYAQKNWGRNPGVLIKVEQIIEVR